MKKTKLLTSLMALVLVVGLGACGESEGDTATSGTDSETSDSTSGNTNTGGDAGDGTWTPGLGIVVGTDDDYPTPEDDTPVKHSWSATGTIYEDDGTGRYHVLACEDCGQTKLEPHQVVEDAPDEDGILKTGHCSVCEATDLNIEGLSYSADFTGNYYVSGYDDSWWVEGNDPIDLYIPTQHDGKDVFSVGAYESEDASYSAFYLTEALQYIGLPNTLTYIGEYAFYSARRVTAIEIPESVTYIGASAFMDCRSMTSVTIPYGITEIKDFTFNGCKALTEVSIPSTVTSIGNEAFEFCYGLTHIDLPTNLTSVGEFVFADTGLVDVTIPKTLTELSERMFLQCYDLKTVILPDTLTRVGKYAFSSCNALTSATFPEDLEYFDQGAVAYCEGLVSLELPADAVTEFAERTFVRCTSLESIVLPAGLTSIGEYCFWRDDALKNVFYRGTSIDQWNTITIGEMNVNEAETANIFDIATIYCYSETETTGNFWHYVDGIPTVW